MKMRSNSNGRISRPKVIKSKYQIWENLPLGLEYLQNHHETISYSLKTTLLSTGIKSSHQEVEAETNEDKDKRQFWREKPRFFVFSHSGRKGQCIGSVERFQMERAYTASEGGKGDDGSIG